VVGRYLGASSVSSFNFLTYFLKYEFLSSKLIKTVKLDRGKYGSISPRSGGLFKKILGVAKSPGLKFRHYESTTAGNAWISQTYLKSARVKQIHCGEKYVKLTQHNQKAEKASYVKGIGGKNIESPLYLGKYPKQVGVKPGKILFPLNFIQHWSESKICPNKYRKLIAGDKVLATGSWSTNQKSVAQFGNVTPSALSFYDLQNALRRIYKKYKFYTVTKPSWVDKQNIRIRPSSGCGGDMQKVFEKKQFGFETCLEISKILENKIVKSKLPTANHSIYTLGARDKRSKTLTGDGSLILSRHVIQQDYPEFILARPWVERVEKALTEDDNFPIFLKHTNAAYGYVKILKQMGMSSGTSVEADWSLFDTTTIRKAIIVAFQVCRNCFAEEDSNIDKLFYYFCSGFLHKYVLMPDGNLFKFSKGTPSGSCWTSVINGIVNLLLLEHTVDKYLKDSKTDAKFKCMVAGDDTVINFNRFIKFDKDLYEKLTLTETGMTIVVEKVGNFFNKNEDKCISFLKTCFWLNTRTMCLQATTRGEDVFKRLYCPQKELNSYKKIQDYLNAQSDLLINSPLSIALVKGFMIFGYSSQILVANTKQLETVWNCAEVKLIMKNVQIYNPVIEDLKLRKRDATTIRPCVDERYIASEINWGYVYNWLYDNTTFKSLFYITQKERLLWFSKQMGVCFSYLPDLMKFNSLYALFSKFGDFKTAIVSYNLIKQNIVYEKLFLKYGLKI
jgi:hypothetical protein